MQNNVWRVICCGGQKKRRLGTTHPWIEGRWKGGGPWYSAPLAKQYKSLFGYRTTVPLCCFIQMAVSLLVPKTLNGPFGKHGAHRPFYLETAVTEGLPHTNTT